MSAPTFMSTLSLNESASNSSSIVLSEDLSEHCHMANFTAFLPYILLLVLQCSLLHPTFAHSRLARWTRMALTPINFVFWISLPFRYCVQPSKGAGQSRLGMASQAFYFAIKSLEWGFVDGAYYRRPLQTIDGVPQWQKVKDDDQSYKKEQENEPCNAPKLAAWTLLQLTSLV